MKTDEPATDLAASDELFQKAMEEVRRAVRNLRFGSVQITIHDSRVVEIERREKIRFALPARGSLR